MLDASLPQYYTVRRSICSSRRTRSTTQLIIPGIVIALLFRCMIALLSPTNRTRGGNRWGLVAHTVALISVATISCGRRFPSLGRLHRRPRVSLWRWAPPGPFGYLLLPKFPAVRTISSSVVQVNQWLVGSLLVSPMRNLATRVLNLGCLHSYIAATSFTA